MPFVIYIFSLCAFALGFTEFITIGLISAISSDLHLDVAHVGLTVTIYALGVVFAAPVLTALTSSWTRKRLLLTAMLVFTLGNILAGLATSLSVLLVARLLSGLAHGVFFAVASSVATRLVAPERAGAALGLVFGGVTVAMSLGVPLGSWLGSILHWQVIFMVIAACGLFGAIGIALKMPTGSGEQTATASWKHLVVLFNPRLLAGASVAMLAYTGSFALYTFITPILLHITGVSVQMASAMLLAYGIGSAIGTLFGGWLSDKQGMDRAALYLLIMMAIILVLAGISLRHQWLMVILIAMLGFTTFGAIPALQSRILMLAQRHAPHAMDIASGMNIAAFNSGVVVGSMIGGITIGAWGLQPLSWVGAVIVLLAIASLLRQIALPSMQARPSVANR